MADIEDMDTPADSLLGRDLSCPVCRGIFEDPVLLPCSHSLCRNCMIKCWQRNKTCPECRLPCEESQAVSNRALKSACESFLKETVRQIGQDRNLDQLCNIHLKPLDLYCEKDEEPVCVDCVPLHSAHRLLSLRDGHELCKQELNDRVAIFEKKIEDFKKRILKFSNAMEFVKHQARQAENQIKAEFERLRVCLLREENVRLNLLAEDEEKKLNTLQSQIDRTNKNIESMEQTIESLKNNLQMEDLKLMQDFQIIKRKAQWVSGDPTILPDALINMSKHVGGLGFNIWKSLQTDVKYYPIVLDPNTASPWLSLSPDLTSVKESPERQTVPDNQERFDPCVFVLGAQGFSSGKHKWDVVVGDNPKWILGVCTDSVFRKKKFTVSPARGVWAIGLSKGTYVVHTQERTELKVQQPPEKIRIKLNMNTGEVSFWDAEIEKHLITLTHKFERKTVYPIFGPGLHTSPMELPPGRTAVHTS